MDAPDRIFAWEQRDTIGTSRGWNTRLSYDAQEYIRAALAAAVPADLAEAGKVLEGVTPGPWVSETLMHDDPNGDEWPTDVEVSSQSGKHIHGHDLGYNDDVDAEIIANARFIAWCREGVPALLARLAAQEAQIKGLEAERNRFETALARCCLVGGQTYYMERIDLAEGRAEAAETALAAEREKVARLVEAGPPFFFDRYINGVRMAEDVCVERETTLEGAMRVAARIAAKGPNGEPPVLVYRSTETAALAAITEAGQ